MICRIWDKENNRFWEDVNEGYNGKIEQLMIDPSGELIMRTIDKMIHESLFPGRFTISWSTGIRDRNDKEAHHKDIVEFEGSKYVVEWDEEDSGFYLAYYKELNDPESDEHLQGKCIRESEIIGNIYQNKELIS